MNAQPAQRHRRAASASRSPASSAPAASNLGTQDARPGRRSRRSPTRSGSTSRSCGRRRARTSTTSRFTVRDGRHARSRATRCTAASARSRSPAAGSCSTAQPLNVRGVGLHEDSKARASRSTTRAASSSSTQAKELGATVLRTHYPLHPYTHELADRLGLLIWSEIPVYSVKTAVLKEPSVRALGGRGAARRTSTPTRTTRR